MEIGGTLIWNFEFAQNFIIGESVIEWGMWWQMKQFFTQVSSKWGSPAKISESKEKMKW